MGTAALDLHWSPTRQLLLGPTGILDEAVLVVVVCRRHHGAGSVSATAGRSHSERLRAVSRPSDFIAGHTTAAAVFAEVGDAKSYSCSRAFLAGPAGVRPRCHGLDAHHAHQALDPLAVDVVPTAAKRHGNPSTAVERPAQVDLVHRPHHDQVVRVRRDRLVCQSRAM
jgi:hypothetical protein